MQVRAVDDPEARIWPPELEPYVNDVAAAAGPFVFEAAAIELVTAEEMATQMAVDIPEIANLPADVADAVRRFDDVHRAFGIATIDFDVLESNRATSLQIQGLYDQSRHRIMLRADTIEEALRPDQEALLVHELVHAWQGPTRVRELAALGVDQVVAGALIEGEAERIALDWQAERPDAVAAPEPLPPGERQAASLIAETQTRYGLGHRLHTALDGLGGVDALIGSGTRIPGIALVDPYGWVDSPMATVELDAPTIDATSLPQIVPPMSAPHWLQVFASAAPLRDALDAARAITSTSTTAVWSNETAATCVAVRVAGDPTRYRDVLQTWVDAAPEHRFAEFGPEPGVETGAVDTTSNDAALVTACDPGIGFVPAPVTTADAAVRSTGHVIDGERWAAARERDRPYGACRVHRLMQLGLVDAMSTSAEVTAALDALDLSVCA